MSQTRPDGRHKYLIMAPGRGGYSGSLTFITRTRGVEVFVSVLCDDVRLFVATMWCFLIVFIFCGKCLLIDVIVVVEIERERAKCFI